MKKHFALALTTRSAILLLLLTLNSYLPFAHAQNTWNLDGNFVSPGQFLGSTNFQAPVDLVAGGMRVWRLEPDARTNVGGLSGNLIGGFIGNVVEQPGSGGNFIGSGGFPAGPNVIHPNSQGVFIGAGSAHQIGPNVNDAVIVGGFGNTVRGFNSFIGSGQNNTIAGARSAINAGSFNQVLSGANFSMIGAGSANIVQSVTSFIGSGQGNTVAGNAAIIGAGVGNAIDAAGFHSSIAAGFNNRIFGASSAAIGGGNFNTIQTNATAAVISGGSDNVIGTNSEFTVIGGGTGNQSEPGARLSTIAGGSINMVQSGAVASTIGGGQQNTSAGQSSTVGGGFLNNSTGDFSTIGGGQQNSASGDWATVPGGFQNRALGQASLAAGALANANHDGAFVWAGGATTNYRSGRPNTFNVYATSGATFEYGGQTSLGRGQRAVHIGPLFAGNTIVAWNGARLSDGGVWVNASDKHRKTDFNEVDPRDVLERLVALPVREWRYTNENVDVKHLGPTAQDFRAVFGFGDDDKGIGTVDADGVALAAIQGLNRKLREELSRRDAENTELKRSVDELKTKLNTLAQRVEGSER